MEAVPECEVEGIEVKIRLFAHDIELGGYLDLVNGIDGYVIVTTDCDERQIMINIEHLKLALRKMTCK